MPVCKFCSKTLKRTHIHEITCKSNPNRVPGKNQYTNGKKCADSTKLKLSLIAQQRTIPAETREKISRARIRFLKDNPDKVPYLLNHYTKGESFPEVYWRNVLENNGINFQQELRIGRFRLDFAVGGILDIEIDGEQHYLDPKIFRSNQRRDQELRDAGWRVLRIRWADFQRMNDADRKLFVDSVVEICRNS